MRRVGAAAALMLWACSNPAPPAEDPIVARIGDEVIRRSEAERGVAMEIFRRRVDIHSLVDRELDRIVEQRLLEREAKRRNLDVETLLSAEIDETVEPVTNVEVEAYLTEHGLQDDRRARARDYLEGTRRIDRKLAFVEGLAQRERVERTLPPPEMPRIEVDIAGAPARGSSNASVTVVHFGSYADPKSAEIARAIRGWRAKHPDAIREIFRPALHSGDELGLRAVLVAGEARAADRFWPVHDALFDRENALRQSDLQSVAEAHGLSIQPLSGAIDPGKIVALRDELDIARRSGVMAPPVVFVNGRWFQRSFGLAKLDELMREELQRALPSVR